MGPVEIGAACSPLTATAFTTLDNVAEGPHLWSGAFFSDETGKSTMSNDMVGSRCGFHDPGYGSST
jgi:hypothetical protein